MQGNPVAYCIETAPEPSAKLIGCDTPYVYPNEQETAAIVSETKMAARQLFPTVVGLLTF